MKIKETMRLSPTERFLYWITERESIRVKKEEGSPRPWTDDEILQQYSFCNVVRMDDRVSRWLWNEWYSIRMDHPNALLACVVARFINHPSALEKITSLAYAHNPSARRMCDVLGEMKHNGEQTFSGAYIIGTGGARGSKLEYVFMRVVQGLLDSRMIADPSSMEGTWEGLRCLEGLGSFMAGQIVADLRWAMMGTWADRMTWAPLGPGSRRGMNRLYEDDPRTGMDQKKFTARLLRLMNDLGDRMPATCRDRMEAMDWQNCLCEMDKYVRTLQGEGKPKRNYSGRSGT